MKFIELVKTGNYKKAESLMRYDCDFMAMETYKKFMKNKDDLYLILYLKELGYEETEAKEIVDTYNTRTCIRCDKKFSPSNNTLDEDSTVCDSCYTIMGTI